MSSLRNRWRAAWRSFGVHEPHGIYGTLVERYQEPHRHYHTLQHLNECLAAFDELRAGAARPAEIELALWFHDAIYDRHSHSNELRSAEWASQAMRAAGIANDACERVHALIMATRHDAAPAGIDAETLVDADLSILAAPEPRFAEYERQIALEYAHVPAALFAAKRKEVLRRFLERERIYSSAAFHEKYEQAARANLRRAIGEAGG